MANASSHDLAPKHGARFVFTRQHGEDDPPVYTVDVHRPDRAVERLAVRCGHPITLEPIPRDTRVAEAVTKLARALKRQPKARLVRWREI
ncbi:MAG: hypothetical protein B7733_23435 [Myxococcales bacterium FL481]|nr:MAG: hypothetical protein B7733_23435 [Myxococcales bacterium FL481]